MIVPTQTFWDVFKATPGALSCAEAIAIMNVASHAPSGVYIELGTHKGKSALAACCALQEGEFNLVDPIFSDDETCANMASLFFKLPSLHISKKLIADTSLNVIPDFNNLSYVFVDSGSHGDGLPMEEAKLLEDRVIGGGIIAWHDFGNQFHEPRLAAEYLVSTGKYDWIRISWSPILSYVKENNLDDGNDSWHQYPELPHSPNFVGAIMRKNEK